MYARLIDMVDLLIYDKNFEGIGIVDLYTSLLWERRFYEAGYFELHAPMTENNVALLTHGCYILRADALECGTALYIQKKYDKSGKTDLTVIGRFLSYLLHGHIIQQDTILRGNVEDIMRGLVESTVITSLYDRIPGLQLGERCETRARLTYAVNYADLHDTLRALAEKSGVGFRIRLDVNTGGMFFECYEPTDRSVIQTDNPVVVFSPEYDTAFGAASYTEDSSEEVNAVIARYSGEYGEVIVDYNPTGARGLNIHAVSIEGDPVTVREEGETVLDTDATREKLLEAAKQEIAKKVTNLYVPVAYEGSYEYRTDYDIGDIVTVQYPAFGVDMSQRIHRITENYTQSEHQIIPEMGEIYPVSEDEEEETET